MPKRFPFVPPAQLVQLIVLGERLRRARQALGVDSSSLAGRLQITRATLRAVEAGAPGVAIATVLQVAAELGVDCLAQSQGLGQGPGLQGHQKQDALSLALHTEAVRRASADRTVVEQAQAMVERWLAGDPSRSAPLWRAWQGILASQDWPKALARTQRGQQLRQASPLTPTLPADVRQAILEQTRAAMRGAQRASDSDSGAE